MHIVNTLYYACDVSVKGERFTGTSTSVMAIQDFISIRDWMTNQTHSGVVDSHRFAEEASSPLERARAQNQSVGRLLHLVGRAPV